MGYSKIIAKAPGKVRIVHQLDTDGKPYAEDVTIEAQEGVPASRVDWTDKDGQVGVVSWSFSPVSHDTSSLKFPESE